MFAALVSSPAIPAGYGGQAADMPPVVVTGTRLGASLAENDRSVSVITSKEINRAILPSVPGLLSLCGADAPSRVPLGGQADLGLRGSSFDQTLVMVDGIRINDPQTGHHNMDVPVPLAVIDHIEVLHGPGSSAHGADAFGGAVNLLTRRPGDTPVAASFRGGMFGTACAALSTGQNWGGLGQGFSVEAAHSDGFREDRDFGLVTAASRTSFTGPLGSTGLTLGVTDRDFGAYDFYTPGRGFPSRERTRTMLAALSDGFKMGDADISAVASVREHFDRFILDRTNPAAYTNEHTTRVYEGGLQASGRPADWLAVACGGELAGDRITSLRLGNHWRPRRGLFGEVRLSPLEPLSLDAGLRHDLAGDAEAWSPSGGLSWWFLESARFRASVGKSFRLPTFTDLYYRDPVNTGNPALLPEEALTYEAGSDWFPLEKTSVTLTFFERDQKRTIDWIGPTSAGPWRAVNSEPMRFIGTEASVRTPWAGNDITLGFAWVSSRYSFSGFSKYALIYPDRRLAAGIGRPLALGISGRLGYEYRRRKDGSDASLLDCRLSRYFGQAEVFLEGTNLLNDRYEDIPGIPQPGIFVDAGLSYRL